MSSQRKESVFERIVLEPGVRELSPRKYNAVIGGVLLWGLLLTAVIIVSFGDKISRALLSSQSMAPFWGILIGYLVFAVIGSILSAKSKKATVSFLGYNLVVVPTGLLISIVVTTYSDATVFVAGGITVIVTAVMMVMGALFPNFFLSIGRVLFFSLLATIVVEVVLMLFGVQTTIIDFIVALIFCGYIGFDWARAQRCAKTADNAVDVCVALYMDIINLFLRVLELVGRNEK